jgi:hypothetical protein
MTHSLKATGFKPLPLNVNPGFKTCRFKCSLRRYRVDLDDRDGLRVEESRRHAAARIPRRGGTAHVDSS